MSPREAQQLSQRVEQLLGEIEESALPPVRDRVEELVRALVSLYGAGLERVVETATPEALGELVADELVASLLVLHDLHPDDILTRVQRALDRVRPYLGSHAGGVELLGVDEGGVVHLRLEGSCDGCPSSAVTVASAIESAVLGAGPDVVGVEVQGVVEDDPGPALLQIPPYRPHPESVSEPVSEPVPDAAPAPPRRAGEGRDRGWVDVDASLAPGTCATVETEGGPVLVANLAGDALAYGERCPDCGSALATGTLDGEVLACPWCRHRWDLRHAGRALDGGALLTPLPLLPEGARWKVSLPVGAGA